jgi:hypothetical protein
MVKKQFSSIKKLYKYKTLLSQVIFPMVKCVYSISEYVIVGENTVLFYTLEEDGLINYSEIEQYKFNYP